jgi:hypothetical protein
MVFLKQYGERRTGTNHLRNLLLRNFQKVTVLMHVLGDKHSPPAVLGTPATETAGAALEWVKAVTAAAPATSTKSGDEKQEEHMRGLAVPLAEAVSRGELGYLISLKDPYAWGASFARYWHFAPLGLPQRRPDLWQAPDSIQPMVARVQDYRAATLLTAACQAFNHKYRSWLEIVQHEPARARVVLHEDLLDHPVELLQSLGRQFCLEPAGLEIETITVVADAVNWDNGGIGTREEQFEANYYRNRSYLNAITPLMRDAITRGIDWELMAEFGYRSL